MKRFGWCAAIVLVAVCMLTMQQSMAELAPDRVKFSENVPKNGKAHWETMCGGITIKGPCFVRFMADVPEII